MGKYDWIKRLAQPKGDGLPVAVVFSDGAYLDLGKGGRFLTLKAYRERFDLQDAPVARHETRVQKLSIADVWGLGKVDGGGEADPPTEGQASGVLEGGKGV